MASFWGGAFYHVSCETCETGSFVILHTAFFFFKVWFCTLHSREVALYPQVQISQLVLIEPPCNVVSVSLHSDCCFCHLSFPFFWTAFDRKIDDGSESTQLIWISSAKDLPGLFWSLLIGICERILIAIFFLLSSSLFAGEFLHSLGVGDSYH